METNIWHKILGSDFIDMRRYVYLSVSVDITDPKEVEILEEVLLMWTNGLLELEIFFKVHSWLNSHYWIELDHFSHISYIIFSFQHKKSHREEGECSTNDITHAKLFPNTDLCVMQKPVILNMMIETSLFPPTKKFNAEAAVAKLMELKYYKNLKIECFWWNFGSSIINCLLAFFIISEDNVVLCSTILRIYVVLVRFAIS